MRGPQLTVVVSATAVAVHAWLETFRAAFDDGHAFHVTAVRRSDRVAIIGRNCTVTGRRAPRAGRSAFAGHHILVAVTVAALDRRAHAIWRAKETRRAA